MTGSPPSSALTRKNNPHAKPQSGYRKMARCKAREACPGESRGPASGHTFRTPQRRIWPSFDTRNPKAFPSLWSFLQPLRKNVKVVENVVEKDCNARQDTRKNVYDCRKDSNGSCRRRSRGAGDKDAYACPFPTSRPNPWGLRSPLGGMCP